MPAAPPDTAPADRPDAAIWRHCVRTDDIDEHAAGQPSWRLHYQQLSSGPFRGTLRHVQLPGVRLVHETASAATHQHGQMSATHFGFAMALAPEGETVFNGQRPHADAIMAGRTDELDLCTPPGFEMIAVVVDEDLLAPLWRHMYQKDLPAWLDQRMVLRASAAAAAAVRELHQAALTTLAEPAFDERAANALRDAVLLEWIEAIPASVQMPDLRSIAARRRVVERACELMLARADEPPSILEICCRIGASPRKLSYCFQHVLGVSPARYLRAVRLNNCRRDLKHPQGPHTSVQDVAARWGFWHLGQFSLDYKRQFGELPSATLRAARLASA